MRIRQLLIILLIAVAVVVSIILIRTLTTNSNQLRPQELTDESVLLSDEEVWAAASRVSGAIQTQPVTFEPPSLRSGTVLILPVQKQNGRPADADLPF